MTSRCRGAQLILEIKAKSINTHFFTIYNNSSHHCQLFLLYLIGNVLLFHLITLQWWLHETQQNQTCAREQTVEDLSIADVEIQHNTSQ